MMKPRLLAYIEGGIASFYTDSPSITQDVELWIKDADIPEYGQQFLIGEAYIDIISKNDMNKEIGIESNDDTIFPGQLDIYECLELIK
jgi:hypothetical protein